MIISFRKTIDRLHQKTVTRRDWSSRHAAQILKVWEAQQEAAKATRFGESILGGRAGLGQIGQKTHLIPNTRSLLEGKALCGKKPGVSSSGWQPAIGGRWGGYCEKCKAIKEGKNIVAYDFSPRIGGRPIGYLELTEKPYLERLCDMSEADIAAEGYPELSKKKFIDKFFPGLSLESKLWVIRFNLVKENIFHPIPTTGQNKMHGQKSKGFPINLYFDKSRQSVHFKNSVNDEPATLKQLKDAINNSRGLRLPSHSLCALEPGEVVVVKEGVYWITKYWFLVPFRESK
ncbi:MAG: hypothetical protein F6K21_05700 [Symploca sp. SIO2D2]|nr:hypothetical protein [Symploca sp. SIO2D2]